MQLNFPRSRQAAEERQMSGDDAIELLELFYEGVMCPQGWEKALGKLAVVTGSQAVSLVLWSRVTDQALVGDNAFTRRSAG